MQVSFENIRQGHSYSRAQLAEIWNLGGPEAIQRGIVTPSGARDIVLFVTEEKRSDMTPYRDRLLGGVLYLEGEAGHGNDQRMVGAGKAGDTIHVFHRLRAREPFTYEGVFILVDHELKQDAPSRFTFRRGSR